MSRSIKEIVNEIQHIKFTSDSGPLLELCRELSSEGRFKELADSVSIWMSKFPQSRHFIRARMPALIVNSHLVNQDILDFSEFLDWGETSDWASRIKEHADNSARLPTTVESIINSMRSYKSKKA